VPTSIPGLPLAPACCVSQPWLLTLDGGRLRQARIRAGLTQGNLAREARVGLSTIGKLERQDRPRCHFQTRARLATALGAHPQALTADTSDHPEVPADASTPGSSRIRPSPTANGSWHASSRTFPARPEQVAEARAFVRQVLGDTPVTDDTALICSELATNTVLHSASAQPGGCFTVRAEVRPGDHAWIEVHDQGGRWIHQPRTSGGRGLAMVDELATHWDIRGDDTGHTICAQLNWPC
jgi:anti-sigma regulatory factor (Ser/Thr protein kinase)/DNA-binding XRE family transcriptional regulator